MYWLLGRNSRYLSGTKYLLVYKQVVKSVWIYGLQVWICTKASNYACIERFQNRVLSYIVNAPWYVRNEDLHRKRQARTVKAEIKNFARRHEERLQKHPNDEVHQLLDNQNLVHRLKKAKFVELM